jgi:hypothetical protein
MNAMSSMPSAKDIWFGRLPLAGHASVPSVRRVHVDSANCVSRHDSPPTFRNVKEASTLRQR